VISHVVCIQPWRSRSDYQRTFGFLSGGDGHHRDPHQSPFWIKAVGAAPVGSRRPARGCCEPQKILSALSCPCGCAPALLCRRPEGGTGRSCLKGGNLAVRFHRSVACGCTTAANPVPAQDRGASVKLLPLRFLWRDAATAQSVLVVVPTPFLSSPPQPILDSLALSQRLCLPRRAPGRVTRNSRPVPVYAPPS
jgi:hypothetical protein